MNKIEPSPVLVALCAVVLACVMDAVIKHLGASYSALTIAFARFGFGAIATGGVYAIVRPPAPTWAALRVHLVRAVAIVAAGLTFFYALAVLPLAEANVLGFAAPLYVPVFARVLLKERLSKLSVAAALVGFVGIVIAAYQPSAAAHDPRHWRGVIAICVSAPIYAFAVVLLRYRAAADGPVTSGLMGNLLPALILAIPALTLAPSPAPRDLPLFVVVGALGATFWLMLTWAYARAPAQRIAPTDYSALIWASLWGYLFFHETPGLQTLIGAGFIIGACILVGLDERRARAAAEVTV